MKAQVLITRTSASSAHDVISIPCCNTLPSMISASTRFFAQPRLTMPTLVPCAGRRFAPKASGATTDGEFMNRTLVNRHVLIAVFQRLAVFRDLNSVGIEDANRYVFPAKFHGAVCWRHPPFEGGTSVITANSNLYIGSFKRPNGDTILFACFCG